MKLTPRHLAATQYTVIAVFAIATWLTLLSPWDKALDLLEFMYSPSNENQEIYVWLAIANLLTVVVAMSFWFKFSASYPFSYILVGASTALLVWSVWWSNSTYIFNFALGLALSIWSWWRANPAFKRDALKRRAP